MREHAELDDHALEHVCGGIFEGLPRRFPIMWGLSGLAVVAPPVVARYTGKTPEDSAVNGLMTAGATAGAAIGYAAHLYHRPPWYARSWQAMWKYGVGPRR